MHIFAKKENLLRHPFSVAVIALFCCMLWGSASPMIKIGYAVCLAEVTIPSSILFAGLRFTGSGILTVLFYSLLRRRLVFPKRAALKHVFTVCLWQTVIQYIFFYIGISITTGVKATVISGTNAFFAILISAVIFKIEKLNAKKVLACILGFAGILLLNMNGLSFTMNIGDACILFSNIAYAVSSLLIKKYAAYEDPIIISGYQFLLGGIFLTLLGWILGGRIAFASPMAVGVVLYLAALSAVAYGLWSLLLSCNPVSKVTIYSFTIPVFGVLLSAILLEEPSRVTPFHLGVALLLMCTGVILLHIRNEKRE